MADPIRFGVFEVDIEARELRKSGYRVKLEQQPFAILLLLLEHPGELVAREELRTRLWPNGIHVDFDRSLNKAMVKLRETLGDLSESPRFIETKPRQGYRFIAPVECRATNTREELPPQVPPRTARYWLKSRARIWTACAALAVALASAAFIWRANGGAVRTRIRGIAVLPLQNLSGDPDQEFFSLGTTDELISALGQIHAFEKVISRTSVMRYKGIAKPLPEIGRELGVDAVVEGSVERGGGRVRIRARLMNAATEAQLWSKQYDREAADLLGLEADVAVAIAQEIRLQVTPQERARLVRPRRTVPAAQEEYLLGRYYRSRSLSPENLKEAIRHFQRATEIDRDFAAPYAGLVFAWSTLVNQGGAGYKEARDAMRTAALKAVELDPDLSDTHVAMGMALGNRDLQGTVDEYQRAIDLEPNNAAAHFAQVAPLTLLGRHSEAIAAAERAGTLDPLSPAVQYLVGVRLIQLRRPELAVPRLRKAIDLDPRNPTAYDALADTYAMTGNLSEALKLEQEAERLGGVSFAPAVGRMYALLGRRAEALQVLERVTKPGAVTAVAHADFETALLYYALGEKDKGFEELAKALEARPFQASRIEVMSRFDSVRSDPRVQALLSRFRERQ